MPCDLLDSKGLLGTLAQVNPSLSRAGRNCVVGIKTPRGTDGGGADRAQPQSARTTSQVSAGTPNYMPTSGDASAMSDTNATQNAGSLTARSRASTKLADASLPAEMRDHRLAFGRGVTEDDGHRRELCSSPRPHPELDAYLLAEYEKGRRSAFVGIQDEAGTLELYDAAAVAVELESRPHCAVPPPSSRIAAPKSALASPLDSRAGNRSPTVGLSTAPLSQTKSEAHAAPQPQLVNESEPLALQLCLTSPTASSRPAGAFAVSPPAAVASAQRATAGMTSPLTSPRYTGGASPRPPKALPSAAFAGPERRTSPTQQRPADIAPSVGHYRPKFTAVEHTVPGGGIDPPAASQSRVPPVVECKDPVSPLHAVLAAAREEVRPRAAKERAARRADSRKRAEMGEYYGDFDEGAARKGAGVPEPSRDSSSPFKSKVAAVKVAAHPTAAPDAMYWPLAENSTLVSPTSPVDFSKQTARPPFVTPSTLPDPRSKLTAFDKDTARNAPDFAKFSPRKAFDSPRRRPPEALLNLDPGYALKFERARVADFNQSSAPSPRSGASCRIASPKVGVSVEDVDAIKHPGDKSAHSVAMATMAPRPEPKPPLDLPPLNLSHDAVWLRQRAAVIRADAGGHGAFAETSRLTAEVGLYNPNVNAVHTKTIRDIDFATALPRQEHRANIADLQYDYKTPASPRVVGNPMIASQVSRAKREAVLSQKSAAADVAYDVKPPAFGPAGMIEFGRQVERKDHVPGRGQQSERMAETARKQQAAHADATLARLAAKKKGDAPPPPV